MSEEAARIREHVARCRRDYKYFAEKHLQIMSRTPADPLLPFKFNKTQDYIDERLATQQAEMGRVRAYILKGRRQGCSTYVQGRYYHRVSLNRNVQATVISHEFSSVKDIFAITDRFQRNNALAPTIGRANAQELYFSKLDSQYTVKTAGSAEGGRGSGPALVHGSECAFWENPEPIYAGLIQAVPEVDGTEVIFESTANGPSGMFYEKWLDAESGIGDYIAIFAPWFWEPSNQTAVPEGFELSDENDDTGVSEIEYAELYGLALPQMAWRRSKIQVLGSKKFRQEYPATSAEAFVASTDDSLIDPTLVLRARKRIHVVGYGPKVLGADPAGFGGDRFALAMRQGNKVLWTKYRNKIDAVEAAAWIKDIAVDEGEDLARINVDAGGLGQGVISVLRTFPETKSLVHAIDFGSKSEHKNAKPHVPGPVNRRVEMWWRMKDWLELEEGVSLPDDDALQSEMSAPRKKPTLDNNLKLESKDDMRKRGIRSPDLADAIALTFASMIYVPVQKPGMSPDEFSTQRTLQVQDPALTFGKGDFSIGSGSTDWMM